MLDLLNCALSRFRWANSHHVCDLKVKAVVWKGRRHICYTNQCWGHLLGHGKYASFCHLTRRIHIILKDKTLQNDIFSLWIWRLQSSIVSVKNTTVPVCIATGSWAGLCSPAPPPQSPEELAVRPRREARGGRRVVPAGPGRRRSPGRCVSLSRLQSLWRVTARRTSTNTAGTESVYIYKAAIAQVSYHWEPVRPRSCSPYGPCRGTRHRSAARRSWAEGWPGWRTQAASDGAALWAAQWEWNWAWKAADPGWARKRARPRTWRVSWRRRWSGGGR